MLKYPPEKVTLGNGQLRDPENLYTWKIGGEYVNSMNILGLVFFSGKETLKLSKKELEYNCLLK